MYTYRLSKRAATQIRVANSWWTENRPAAPDALVADLEAAFAIIAEFPRAGEPALGGSVSRLRRLLLGKTQYFLYYRIAEEPRVVEVLALWHASRGSEPKLG